MKVVSFVNMKGGVGKTTLAVNVAHTLNKRHGKRVLLIDLDPQFNATQCIYSAEKYVTLRARGEHTIVHIFDETPSPSISPISGVATSEAIELADIKPWQVTEGLHLIPGDLELHRIDIAGGQGREFRLRRYIEHLRENEPYDYVIIDTPPTPSIYMTAALVASSHYLVPVKPDPISRIGIDLLRGVVERISTNFGHKIRCVGLVLTISLPHLTVFKDAKADIDQDDFWSAKLFDAHLPARTKIAKMQGQQGMILDIDDYESKTSLSRITYELMTRLKDG